MNKLLCLVFLILAACTSSPEKKNIQDHDIIGTWGCFVVNDTNPLLAKRLPNSGTSKFSYLSDGTFSGTSKLFRRYAGAWLSYKTIDSGKWSAESPELYRFEFSPLDNAPFFDDTVPKEAQLLLFMNFYKDYDMEKLTPLIRIVRVTWQDKNTFYYDDKPYKNEDDDKQQFYYRCDRG